MNKLISKPRHARSSGRIARGLGREQLRGKILKGAEEQFAAGGLASTTVLSLSKAAGVSEAMLYSRFGTKQKLFQEIVERNAQDRLAGLRDRFFATPESPPLECIQSMAESTILACVGDLGNASMMAWALLEMPEFAADVYRSELGATEALWNSEISRRQAESPLRTRVNVHLVPYAVRVSMAFGLWLATLRHKSETAQEHARQFTSGIVDVARVLLDFSPRQPSAAALK